MRKRVCSYSECKLPVNNHRYLWQLAYILLGLIVLYWRESDFTFFQVFLFVFPILIDVSYSTLSSKIMNIVRGIFFLLNLLVLSICILGFMDIMSDTGNAFFIELEVFNFQFALKKAILGCIMFPNIIIPVLYYGASPCQKNEETINISTHKHEKGRAK